MRTMQSPPTLPEYIALTRALQRLSHSRLQATWVRIAASIWSVLVLAWFLPLDSWSALELDSQLTVVVGVLLGLSGLGLGMAHRRLSNTAALRAAWAEVERLAPRAASPGEGAGK